MFWFCLLTVAAIPPWTVIEQRTTTRPPDALARPAPDWQSWSYDLPRESGVWVWGCRIAVGEVETGAIEPLGIRMSLLGAYEIYWDGVLIARNGRSGTDPASEEPGNLRFSYVVPSYLLTPGEHFIAAKISSFHAPRGKQFLDFELGDIRTLERRHTVRTVWYMSMLSGSLPAALLFLGLFFWAERRGEYLIFGVIALLFPLLLTLEFSKFLVPYTYDWHFRRLQAIVGVSLALACLLPLFFTKLYGFRFNPWRYGVLVGLSLGVVLMVPYYDTKTTIPVILALIDALVLSCQGIRRGAQGAWVMAFGLVLVLASFVGDNTVFHDKTFFISLLGLIIAVMGLLIVRFRDKSREVLRARLQAEQLKGELLRKQIQPHFLMNSLTTAMEYMEENPQLGTAMVDALCRAFRLLLDLCDRDVVTVGQELALCRAHLDTMNFVTDRAMRLEAEGLDLERLVPPGLFLTLLENALTHGRYEADLPFVTLSQELSDGRLCYQIGSLLKKVGAAKSVGTGTRYIEARLRQVFGEAWSLHTKNENGRWITLVEVPEHVEHCDR